MRMGSNETTTFTFEQDILAANVGDLRQQLLETLKEHSDGTFVLNCQNVSIIDSSGIGLIISTYNQLKKDGRTLEIVNVSDDIMKMCKVMRLDRHFTIKGTA